MNRIIAALVIIILFLIGCSLLLFVFRMMWLSPSPMGMMMGSNIMWHHMGIWMGRTFLIVFIFVIILLLMWFLKNKRN